MLIDDTQAMDAFTVQIMSWIGTAILALIVLFVFEARRARKKNREREAEQLKRAAEAERARNEDPYRYVTGLFDVPMGRPKNADNA